MDSLAYVIRLSCGGAFTLISTPRLLWQAYRDATTVRALRVSVFAARSKRHPLYSIERIKHVVVCIGKVVGELPTLVGKDPGIFRADLEEKQQRLAAILEAAESVRQAEMANVHENIQTAETELHFAAQNGARKRSSELEAKLKILRHRLIRLEEKKARRPISQRKTVRVDLQMVFFREMFREVFKAELKDDVTLITPLAHYTDCETLMLDFIEYCLKSPLTTGKIAPLLLQKLLIDFADEVRKFMGKSYESLPPRNTFTPAKVSWLKHWADKCNPNMEAGLRPDLKSQFYRFYKDIYQDFPFKRTAPPWYFSMHVSHGDKFANQRVFRLVDLASFQVHLLACSQVDRYVLLFPRNTANSFNFQDGVRRGLGALRAQFEQSTR